MSRLGWVMTAYPRRTDLHPGDLCVVESTCLPDLKCYGRTVILLSWYVLEWHPECISGIYWRVSGLPANAGVHQDALRKIPPAPMDDDVKTEQELAI